MYDIEENSDCSVDALISDNVRDLVALFRGLPTAKASFATKFVNPALLDHDPQGRTRIRLSLMPREEAKVLDIRTSSIDERIAAADSLVSAGYEVHLNFNPSWSPRAGSSGGRSCLRSWPTGSAQPLRRSWRVR